MEITAKLGPDGQLIVPKVVRDALGLAEGDDVVFRVAGRRAELARSADFLSLAEAIAVPANRANVAWDDVLRRTRTARLNDRH